MIDTSKPNAEDVEKVTGVEEAKEAFTPEEFEKAWQNAGPLAKARLMRKARKTKFRAAYYSKGGNNKADMEFGPAGVRRRRLPPADLDKYIANFVAVHKDKGGTNA
jgi:hypothetical protein